jgi:hypothetical protein
MTVYYSDVRVVIDPEMSDPLKDGGRLQDVSVILTDKYPYGPSERPAATTLAPWEARELAFELLQAAEHADRMRTHP